MLLFYLIRINLHPQVECQCLPFHKQIFSGNTSRWGVAWSHEPSIPPLLSPNSKKVSTTYSFTTKTATSQTLISQLQSTLAQLHVQISPCPDMSGSDVFCVWVTAAENTWAHSRRKRRRKGSQKRESDGNSCLTRDENEDQILPAKKQYTDQISSEQTLRIDNQILHKHNNIEPSISNSEVEIGNSSHSVHVIEGSSVCEPSKVCLFHCLLSIEETEEGVSVDFTWIFGSDKDSLNQFCCYVAKSICNPSKDSCG